MSYAAFGDTQSWGHICTEQDEVYLLRARVNVEIKTAEDLRPFVKAFALAQNYQLNVRGATAKPLAGGYTQIDIIGTADDRDTCPDVVFDYSTVATVVDKMMQDSELRSEYPGLQISDYDTLELTGPPQAVDFWRMQSVLWDVNLGENTPTWWYQKSGLGQGTQAYIRFENLRLGTADDGSTAKLLPRRGALPPIGTGSGSGGNTTGEKSGSDVRAILLVAGIGIAAYVLTRVFIARGAV